MKNFISFLILLMCWFALLLVAKNSTAQENIVVSGGDLTGNSGFVSFSVGQLFYRTVITETGQISEGLHQPYEIYVVSAGTHPFSIDVSIEVFPNPARDVLNIMIDADEFRDLSYQLLSIQGKTMASENISQMANQVYVEHLNSGIYLLVIYKNNRELKTFKIIKNH